MELWNLLMGGFATAATPINLMWSFLGCALGTAIGVLPGLGPAVTIALLLPLTFKVDATAAFILFAGIYYGAMYGGSTTSILLNTPGEPGAMMTAVILAGALPVCAEIDHTFNIDPAAVEREVWGRDGGRCAFVGTSGRR